MLHTTASLLLRARHITDRDVDPALVDNTHVLPWLNEALRELTVLCAKLRPEEFAAVSSSFSISSGNTFAIAAGGADGVSAAQFLELIAVDRTPDAGAHWTALKRFRFSQRGLVSGQKWFLRKRTLIIEPATTATLYPLRYWYAEAPTVLTNGGESIDLVPGGDQYLIQHCAVMTRLKFEEDSLTHLALKNAAEQAVRRYLDSGPVEAVRGADPYDDEDDD